MSTINAQNYGDGTDSVPASAVLEGTAKVWVETNAGLSTINDSYNVSSITDGGTGLLDTNINNNFDSANYFKVMTASTSFIAVGLMGSQPTSSVIGTQWRSSTAGTNQDPNYGGNVMGMGDLA